MYQTDRRENRKKYEHLPDLVNLSTLRLTLECVATFLGAVYYGVSAGIEDMPQRE